MMGLAFGVLLDVIVIALLAATMVNAVRLNRRLESMRNSRDDLQKLVKDFDDLTGRVDIALKGLRKAATESGEALQSKIAGAVKLRDELSFMIESGDNLASRLEAATTNARPAAQPAEAKPADLPPLPEIPPKPSPEARSRAERELMQAIENIMR